jgi:glycerophosphoryl diester phosphodiesterase
MAFALNPLRVGSRGYLAGVLNIAHRGARAYAPENTLVAFEKAKTFGCPMFEMDVHMSKDGELVVHHDDELTRCTDVKARFPGRSTYYVSDFTYDDLRLLDAGSWYIEQLSLPVSQRQTFLQMLTDEELDQFVSLQERELYASGEIGLPTLKQTLELVRRTDMMVNIELKTLPRMYPGLADAVVKLVESLGLDQRVLISSFDHEQLVRVRQLTNVIATGVLTSDRLANPGEYLRLLDADAYNPGCYGDYDSMGFSSVSGKLDPCGIINARVFGRGVNVWTCNDKNEMRQLIASGVTGVISDFPNRVRDVLEEQPERICFTQ